MAEEVPDDIAPSDVDLSEVVETAGEGEEAVERIRIIATLNLERYTARRTAELMEEKRE